MSNISFHSPWLAQLNADRAHFKLEKNTECDIAVVGAGIAGVMTAYQLLKHTDQKILLLEAGRIAHGATGRNAGQLVSEFERPLRDIARAFGTEMAIAGQVHIETAWGLLEDIVSDCDLKTPINLCAGYAGLTTLEQITEYLEEHHFRVQGGIKCEPMLIRIGEELTDKIPTHLQAYILKVPHSLILKALGTDNAAYIAMTTSKKGCMNGALLCEELIAWMYAHYENRLQIAEHLPLVNLILRKNDAVLETEGPSIKAKRVVLCTNGFENFNITNDFGEDIDVGFHAMVRCDVGYAIGYIDEPGQNARAISYHCSDDYRQPYYYLTRRPYEHAEHGQKTLLCFGGPERHLPDRAIYNPNDPPPADTAEELERVLHESYKDLPQSAKHSFLWQGPMGYTPNYLRRVGYEPKNPILLYNLGCNGVGIMSSIYGGKRIAQLLSGIQLPPSIFDPEKGNL